MSASNRRLLQPAVNLIFLVVFASLILGPLVVLALWSVAQQWFWPSILPTEFTFRWHQWAIDVPMYCGRCG